MFQRNHDVILYYVKTSEAIFNKLEGEATKRQRQLQEAGYNLGSSGGKPIVRIYDKSKCVDKIEKWKEEGRAIYYVEQSTGNSLPDVWAISNLNGQSKERTGFRTQKPLALLDRIIEASSKKDDIVFDPFCGCATTLVSADGLNHPRKWVGIDISSKAVELVIDRIKEAQGMFEDIKARIDIPERDDLGKLPAPRTHLDHLYGVQGGYCKGCDEHYRKGNLEVDHIVAKAKGGNDHLKNLQLLCGECNRKKGSRDMAYLMSLRNKTKEILELV